MAHDIEYPHRFTSTATAMERRRRLAWILILIVDAGFVAWGAMAAIWPDHLFGPGGTPILTAGYEGFSRGSWWQLATTAPMAASYMEVLFRMYGIFNVVFGLMGSAIAVTAFRRGERWAWWTLAAGNVVALASAMRYDWIVNAIGPFELTEYLGLALVLVALAITVPVHAAPRSVAGSMSGRPSTFEVSAHMTVRPGQLEGFRKQAAECIRITNEQDTRTLRYDWFLSNDGTECEVREAYTGPDGLIEHNSHIMQARAKLFRDYADNHFMTVYGEPSQHLLELLKAHAGGFTWFTFVQGLEPSRRTPAPISGAASEVGLHA